jgi:hypothetical protein
MIEVKHKEFRIVYSEDNDEWQCFDVGYNNIKLSAVKRFLDEKTKKERRVNIPALMAIRSYRTDAAKVEDVTVTLLCEPESDYASKPPTIRSCWIKDSSGERKKVNIHNLMPVSARADALRWQRYDDAACAATKMAHDALAALPKFDADSLMLAAKEKDAAK